MWPFLMREKRLGLALGGGSARGLAHIGVLRVLEDAGLRPTAIAGTSMGSIVGAFAAAGYGAAELEQIATGMDVRDMVSFADINPRRAALVNGERVEAWLREWLPATFEELATPFVCVSVDLVAGSAVLHTSGDLPRAVRASCSIPGVFAPVADGERLLVDGGVLQPVPVPALRDLRRSDVDVAVSVSGLSLLRPGFGFGDDDDASGSVVRFWRKIRDGWRHAKDLSQAQVAFVSLQVMQHAVEQPALSRAAVVIEPAVSGFDGRNFMESAQIIAVGEQAAADALPDVLRRLRRSA